MELDEIRRRLERLESIVLNQDFRPKRQGSKAPTLPELLKRGEVKNGQQKVAAIVGYYEMIEGKTPVTVAEIREGWRIGRIPGKFATMFLYRAIKEALVRNVGDDAYDLSSTGEAFFEQFNASLETTLDG